MYARFREGEEPKVEGLYPVTVIKSRYGGYEGGDWLAFNCDPDKVPTDVWGSDMECFDFFESHERSNPKKNPLKIGRGNTPDEALKNLVAQYYG